jgi:hypothetical protein
MRKNTATSLIRETQNNVVKVPVTSQFAGDSILSLRLTKKATAGAPSGAFPIPLFGAIHEKADYTTFAQDIPAGYALTLNRNSDGSVDFDYSDGTNEITITVSSSTLPYRSILAALLEDFIKVSTTRMTVSPSTKAADQFSEKMVMAYKSIFGGSKSNEIEVDINQKPDNFRDNIIDIPQTLNVDKNSAIIAYFNAGTDTINFNFTTSNYSIGKNNL